LAAVCRWLTWHAIPARCKGQSSEARQGQCCTRNLETADVREEM
jgi:hypothetical protein